MLRLGLLLVSLFHFGNIYADSPLIALVWEKRTNCDDGLLEKNYVSGDVRAFRFMFSSDRDEDTIFGYNSSRVEVYDPSSILAFRSPFVWKSNMMPKGVERVVVISSDRGIEIRKDAKSGSFAQLAYFNSRKYAEKREKSSKPVDYEWTLPDGTHYKAEFMEKPIFDSDINSTWSCINITVK